MSKLSRLLNELCPEGVEYKTLGEIASISRGGNFQKKHYVSNGIPCIHYGQIYTKYNLFVNEADSYIESEVAKKQKFAESGDIIMAITSENVEDVCKCIAWLGNDKVAVSGHTAIIHHNQNPKYLVYYLSSQMFQDQKRKMAHGTKVIEVSPAKLNEVKVAVPPLEVQREIVHILDSFTLLTAELTAELTARKKQYEFYQNKLLKFDNKVKIVNLSDIADIGTGSSNTNESIDDSRYPFYVRSQEPLRKNDYEFDETAIITAGDGVGVGKVFHYVEGKYALHQRAYRIHINSPEVLPRYYFHYMRTTFLSYIQKSMFQSSVASIRRPMLNAFPVPIPSLDVQQRLVNVLDNFETICSDLSIGLPAEIEARKKQYEYYRDVLLTFAETGKTILTDRQTDRQTELNIIKLVQYVFGYAIVRLDYIANFRNGKGHEKNIVADGKYIVVNSKFISTDGQVKKYSNEQICPLYVNDVLMVMSDLPSGRALAKCYLVDEDDKYTLNQRIGAFMVRKTELVTTKYLYYMLNRNPQLLKYDNGADQTNLRKADILNISIAIPTIREQKRITEILDRFDTLCNDLSTGLPAEIEARQKQYEYYRDKLLSFKEL